MQLDLKERRRAIDQALVALEKQFGKGTVQRLGSTEAIAVPQIPVK